MRIVVADCTVNYAGRLAAHLPRATRLIIVKADGSLLVHAEAGAYKPLNWMNAPNHLVEEDGRWFLTNGKGEQLTIDNYVIWRIHDPVAFRRAFRGIMSAAQKRIDRAVRDDVREVIARIVDGSRFHEFKPDYGTTAVCGFAFLYGWKVGIIGNNGVLFSDSAQKCTQFMQLCNRDRVPMIFLQNITGFMVGKEYEHGGITKDGAKMLMVQANLDVPKLTIMTNGSFGAGNYAMCGRAYDPRFLFSWPNSQISVMGMEQAASTLAQIRLKALERQGKTLSEEERQLIYQEITQDYIEKSSAYHSTSEMWDDGIIDPPDSRKMLGICLSVSLIREFGATPHGVLRI